jgi:hypothetical protein
VWPESLAHKNTRSITDADRNAILLATKPLRLTYANYLFGWLDAIVQSPDCVQPTYCHSTKSDFSSKLWRPPGLSMTLSWPSSVAKGLCKPCIALGKKHHAEGATRLWKELPSFFNLPPWEELVPPS